LRVPQLLQNGLITSMRKLDMRLQSGYFTTRLVTPRGDDYTRPPLSRGSEECAAPAVDECKQ